jgi:hypothetical protein
VRANVRVGVLSCMAMKTKKGDGITCMCTPQATDSTPPSLRKDNREEDTLYMMTHSLSFGCVVSPPSPLKLSRCTMESCAIGPAKFPRKRSVALLSPRSAAFLNIAVALHVLSPSRRFSRMVSQVRSQGSFRKRTHSGWLGGVPMPTS